MSKHALLSASGAYRWMACPPSALLEAEFPETQSAYAEEGTLAHEIASLMLTKHFYTDLRPSEYKKQLAKLQANPLYSPTMMEHVNSYYDYIVETYQSLNAPTILIETKIDLSEWIPKGFGTCDCVLISDGVMHVVDLKYGQGVPVSAQDNPQIQLYALGALNTFNLIYDIDQVVMTIFQPRIENTNSAEILAEELIRWGDETVKPLALLAADGKGEFKAGEHCQFCRAKAKCRARAEENLKAAQYEFAEPPLLTDDEIAEILNMSTQLKSWVADIEEYALVQARDHGKEWPGWKLVEGRSNRIYSDPDQVASTLIAAGIEESMIYERVLLGITKMEKMLGKKKLEELAGNLIIKPPGKPTLVPETDKRPALNSAITDFMEDDLNGN